ncbi:hypothetical protein T492DRAFT_843856 [Pavlovales sp. CCMP2436]|nr:hypothetical protein T492DRAFT_843856 [Pavlovales sp. CCMP2436]
MRVLTDLGLEVHVTELDVDCNFPQLPCVRLLPNVLKWELQATVFASVVRVCLEFAKCIVLSTWGFTDKLSWRAGPGTPGSEDLDQHAHQFDREYAPKPAAFAYSQALQVGQPA